MQQRSLSPSIVPWMGFCFYLACLCALFSGNLLHGFIGDGAGYVSVNTWEYATHPLFPFLSQQDTGHPLIYAWINGVLIHLLGHPNLIANLSILVYAAWALAVTQWFCDALVRRSLGKCAPRLAGVAAALALGGSALFITHAVQYVSAIPHMLFCLMLLWSWYTRRRGWVMVFALLTAMTQLTGPLFVLGVGLFDLGREMWRNPNGRLRAALHASWPYLVCTAIFLSYLGIKLLVLKLPLTVILVNQMKLPTWDFFLLQLHAIGSHLLALPSWTIGIWLLPCAVALVVCGIRRLMKQCAQREQARRDASPSVVAIYAAFVASYLPAVLFYACHPLWPQPRWFLPVHAFIIIAGVHACCLLVPRWRALLVIPLVLLCAVQVLRWYPAWIEKALARQPDVLRRLDTDQFQSLEVLQQVELYHEFADWTTQQPLGPTMLIAAWPSTAVIDLPSRGYVDYETKSAPIGFLGADPQRSACYLSLALRQGYQIYLARSSWDNVGESRQLGEFLSLYPEFRPVGHFADRFGQTLDVYALVATPAWRSHVDQTFAHDFSNRAASLLLNRPIDMPAYESWLYQQGLASRPETVLTTGVEGIINSPEFAAKVPDGADRVNRLFRLFLDRPPSREEAEKWLMLIHDGRRNWPDLVEHLATWPEFEGVARGNVAESAGK